MRLGIDAMGGDFAPLECIKGAKLFCQENISGKYELVLFGDENLMRPMIESVGGLMVAFPLYTQQKLLK